MSLIRRLSARLQREPAAASHRAASSIAGEVEAVEASLADRRRAAQAELLSDQGRRAHAVLMRQPIAAEAADEADALERAAALSGRGHDRAAEALLAPMRHESAKLAIAHARAAMPRLSPAEAVALWGEALDRFPTAAIGVGCANALVDDLRYDDAIALLDGLIAGDPRASLKLARIRIDERIGAFGSAADRAAAAGEATGDATFAAEADRLARDAGRGDGVAEIAALPPARDAGWAAAARRRANALIAAGDLADAVALLDEVVAARGGANDGLALTNAVLLSGDAGQGDHLAGRFAAAFPGDARFALKRAQLAERAGDTAAMLEHFVAALACDPGNAAAASGIARALTFAGRFDAARDWLEAATADPTALWAYTNAAFVEMRAGRREAAVTALDRAYAAAAGHLIAYRTGRAGDHADTYTLDGRHRRHPSDRAVRSADLFDRFLADVTGPGRTMLVGNSPRLIGERRGTAIDACDTVIRLNDFRIAGFEDSVGTRTDWWFSSANRQAEPDRASVGAANAILAQPVAQHVPELPEFLRGRLRLDLGPDRACFLPPFVHPLSDLLLYPGRSTGMRMILILEFVAQAPFEMIGFDFFDSSGLHYFENGADRLLVGESHATAFERAFVDEVLTQIGRYARYAS